MLCIFFIFWISKTNCICTLAFIYSIVIYLLKVSLVVNVCEEEKWNHLPNLLFSCLNVKKKKRHHPGFLLGASHDREVFYIFGHTCCRWDQLSVAKWLHGFADPLRLTGIPLRHICSAPALWGFHWLFATGIQMTTYLKRWVIFMIFL